MIIQLVLFTSLAVADATNVKVYRHSDPPDTCEEIGNISTPNIQVLDDPTREQMLRRLADKQGANAMQITSLKGDELTAVIFKCKK